jgi:Caspase domain
VNDSQSQAFQDSLRNRVKGVRQVDEHSSKQNESELNVSVAKDQDLPFKQSLFSQLSGLGLGTFEVVAREGEVIYLWKAGGSMSPQQDTGSRQPPPGITQGAASPTVPSVGTTKYNPGYRKSWAVLIGINEYQQWPKLKYAVNDARSIENLVRGLGFNEVITLLDGDATQQRILRVLGDELYTQTQDDDRVFIFYAGHGQTQDLPANKKDGYIIPVDGDLTNYYSTAISIQQLQGLADRIRAKHIFYAMDACFSGLLLRNFRGEALNDSPMKLTIAPARQVLTAGAEGEKVVETGGHGLFTKSLLSGLTGNADLNKDRYITATELSQYITSQVLAESRNSQNPLFGRLGDGQGEFVFELK